MEGYQSLWSHWERMNHQWDWCSLTDEHIYAALRECPQRCAWEDLPKAIEIDMSYSYLIPS
jgi:hypothetical protein